MGIDPSIYDVPTPQDVAAASDDQRQEYVEAWAREVYARLGAARQTNSLNSGWHDLEARGRALFREG